MNAKAFSRFCFSSHFHNKEPLKMKRDLCLSSVQPPFIIKQSLNFTHLAPRQNNFATFQQQYEQRGMPLPPRVDFLLAVAADSCN